MNSPQEDALPFDADVPREAKASGASSPVEWPRRILVALLALFLIGLGYNTIYRTAWNDIERTDFTVYSAAGRAVLDGADIYQAHNARGWFYVYPPTFAVFLPPFAILSLAWGSGLWYLLSLLCVISAAVMAVRLALAAMPPPLARTFDVWTLWEVSVFLTSPWLVSGLLRCQASEYMVWLMIAAVYCGWRGRPVLGGLSLAAATLIKAFPLALLAYFVWRRQWRFTGAVFLGLLLGGLFLPALVFGWQQNLDYWQQWVQLVAGPALSAQHIHPGNNQAGWLYEQLLDAKKLRNQSLESLLLTLDVPAGLVKPWLAGCALVMLGVMTWLAQRAAGFAPAQMPVIAAFLVWNLLIPPISETHYFGLLLLPLAVLTLTVQADPDRFSRRLALAALLLAFIATLWTNLDKDMQSYRLLCWASLAVWASLLGLAWRRLGVSPVESV